MRVLKTSIENFADRRKNERNAGFLKDANTPLAYKECNKKWMVGHWIFFEGTIWIVKKWEEMCLSSKGWKNMRVGSLTGPVLNRRQWRETTVFWIVKKKKNRDFNQRISYLTPRHILQRHDEFAVNSDNERIRGRFFFRIKYLIKFISCTYFYLNPWSFFSILMTLFHSII